MPEVDLWRRVNLEEQAWEDAAGAHKMGKIHPGDIVHLVEEYNGWYRIDYGGSTAPGLVPPDDQYKEHWVQDNDLGLFGPLEEDEPDEPEEPEEPDEATDAELAGALRTLKRFFQGEG